jgi:hypothetical protein
MCLLGYKDRVISRKTKNLFDTFFTGLSIAFGMNVASGLKGIAVDLRWWVLSIKKRSSLEVRSIGEHDPEPLLLTVGRQDDLISHCDSMTALLKLAFKAPRLKTVITCLFWVFLNIASTSAAQQYPPLTLLSLFK